MLNPISELRRALAENTGGGYEGIADILPKEVDKIITQMVEHLNPLRQNIPRKPGSGAGVYINRRTPGSTKAAFYADTDSFDEETGTYEQVEFLYKTIGTQGKVTRKARAIGSKYIDILTAEMEAKAEDFKDKEEYAICWGDSSANAKEFDGLYKLCDSSNIIPAGSDNTGGDLTLALLDQALDAIRGMPSLIVCSKRTRRRIRALLQAQQRFINMVKVKGGFEVLSYNEVPILVSNQIPDTQQVSASGATITSLTGGNLSTLFVVDTSKVFISELTPLTVQPLAKESSQYDKFDIFADEVLVARDPQAISCIVGIR